MKGERWRMLLAIPVVLIIPLVMVLVDVPRSLLASVHRSLFAILKAVVDWATLTTEPTDGQDA